MPEAARVWTTVGADIAPLEAGYAAASAKTDAFARSLQRRAGAFQSIGRSWSRYITAPIVATGAVATKMALDFQKNMTLIQTSAGGSAKDVKLLSNAVLDLAKNSKFGPNELAKGLYHLKSLGLDNATALKALKIASDGATAGQADLESTASALGAAIRTNIKGTHDYKAAMAELLAIVGSGNMRMQDLIGALGTGILPAAKAAGLSLRDVGAALATMTDEGMPADAAATRLRMGFNLMAAASKKGDKALHEIGLSSAKLGITLQGPNGLVGAIQLIRDHLGKIADDPSLQKWARDVDRGRMSYQQFIELAAKTDAYQVLSHAFGGARSSAALLLLINNLGVLKQKYAQAATITDHYAASVKAANNTDLSKLQRAWSNVEVALIKTGSAITPVVVKMAQGLSTLSDWFSKLHAGTQAWLLIVAGAGAAFGVMLNWTGKLITSLRTIQAAFGVEAVASSAATKTVVAGAAEQTGAIEVEGKALKSLTSLFGVAAASSTLATKTIVSSSEAQAAAMDVGPIARVSRLGTMLGMLARIGTIVIGLQIVESFLPQGKPMGIDGKLQKLPLVGGLFGFGEWIGQQIMPPPGPTTMAEAGWHRDANGVWWPAAGQGGMSAAQIVAQGGGAMAHNAFAGIPGTTSAQKARNALAAERNRIHRQFSKLFPDWGYSPPAPPSLASLTGGGGSTKKGKAKRVKMSPLNPALSAIVAAARKYGIDPAAMIAIAHHESGLNPAAIGDYGTSFGLFQLHKGGALGSLSPQLALNPYVNALVAARAIAAAGGRGLVGSAAISLISRRFERPANPGSEISDAIGYYAQALRMLHGGSAQSISKLFPNFASFQLADPAKIQQDAALIKQLMNEAKGLSGDAKTKFVANLKSMSKALLNVVTPSDLTALGTRLSAAKGVISKAVTAMTAKVAAEKQTFQTAWGRIATAAMAEFDRKTQEGVTAIQDRYQGMFDSLDAQDAAQTPAEAALAALQAQRSADQRNKALLDAQKQLAAARRSGNPDDIAAALDQLQNAQLDIQEAGLQAQADAQRKALDARVNAEKTALQKQEDAEVQGYQDMRDRQKQAFQDMLDNIETQMENGTISVKTGLDDMTALFKQFGVDLNSTGPVIAGKIYDTLTASLAAADQQAQQLQADLHALGLLKNAPAPRPAITETFAPPGGSYGTGGGRSHGFALGGVIHHRRGGSWLAMGSMFANVGEGANDEVIAPLSSLSHMLGGPQVIELHNHVHLDGKQVMKSVRREVVWKGKRNAGNVFAGQA